MEVLKGLSIRFLNSDSNALCFLKFAELGVATSDLICEYLLKFAFWWRTSVGARGMEGAVAIRFCRKGVMVENLRGKSRSAFVDKICRLIVDLRICTGCILHLACDMILTGRDERQGIVVFRVVRKEAMMEGLCKPSTLES